MSYNIIISDYIKSKTIHVLSTNINVYGKIFHDFKSSQNSI
jgi:hypothetical protein